MIPTPSPRRLRRGAVALATAALGLPLAASIATTPAVGAEPTNPSIDLTAPESVTAYAFDKYVYTDIGVRLEVTGADLKIVQHRDPDYQSPPTAVAKFPTGDVTLPQQKTVGKLHNFLRYKLVKVNGPAGPAKVRKLSTCLGDQTERMSPDAPFRNPYPRTCYYNSFALGAVQGIPQGWSTGVIGGEGGFRAKAGEYQLTVWIAKAYADALGLSAEQRTATTQLTVVSDGFDCSRGCRAPGATPRLKPNRHEPDPKGGVDSLEDLPPGTPVPDLRSLPAFGIQLNKKGTQLRFAANVWNAGNSPLVVDGFRRKGEDVMDAYQYFLDENGEQVDYQPVGTMIWHDAPSHNHWHFNDFATYELLKKDKSHAVRSGKESFCLANTDAVDLTVENAAWEAWEEDLGSVCGGYDIRSIREVLSSGWGDTYTQIRAGQSFPIKNLPNGVYWIRVLANPDNTLIESDTDNNESLRRIRLYTDKHGVRQVRVAKVGVIDEEQGIYGRSAR